MDSLEGSSSAKNQNKLERDSEQKKNCKNLPVQSRGNDDGDNVFVPMSHQIESSSSPQNGPRSRNLNSVSKSECGLLNKFSENNSEGLKAGTSQSGCNRLSSTSNDQLENPSSKSDSKSCDNGFQPELQTCQRHKMCMDKVVQNVASTSGTSKSNDSYENSYKESRKRPSSLKLNRPNLDDESSSDTGNDDYSLGSEDGCIYTYRGGEHLADLPSSFFSLDMGLPLDKHLPIPPNYAVPQGQGNARDRESRASSPDMDFLEMDFDPGPSCEVDTGDESSPDVELEAASNMPEESEPVIRGTSPEYLAARAVPIPAGVVIADAELYRDVPSTSQGIVQGQGNVEEARVSHSMVYYGPYITHVNARGEQLLVRRTMSHCPHTTPVTLHVSSGDLVSPREMLNYDEDHTERPFAHQINQSFDSANLSSALYHMTMAKRLMVEKTKSESEGDDVPTMSGDASSAPVCTASTSNASIVESKQSCSMGCTEPPRCMVWSEREACERQVTQIGTSACGATAVINAFIALGVPVNTERINSAVGTRQRANNAPLPRYIFSRAVAGCTAADLINGIQSASNGRVTARFFPTYPERAVSLSHWLADWICLGAVPILTLNLQAGCEGEIPDAWHHQMVFGVSPRGVYLCNPVECVRETALWPRLTSPSVLLVRTRDVLTRFSSNTDLRPLMVVPDRRFHTFNVLGQVINVIREWRATGWNELGTRTRHIRIPASYQAGVTVAALTGSEAHRRLMHAPQLPILAPQTEEERKRERL